MRGTGICPTHVPQECVIVTEMTCGFCHGRHIKSPCSQSVITALLPRRDCNNKLHAFKVNIVTVRKKKKRKQSIEQVVISWEVLPIQACIRQREARMRWSVTQDCSSLRLQPAFIVAQWHIRVVCTYWWLLYFRIFLCWNGPDCVHRLSVTCDSVSGP